MSVTVQVSVYPLGESAPGPSIRYVVEWLQTAGLIVESGSMGTVVAGNVQVVFDTLSVVFGELAGHGQIIMVVTFPNA